MWGILGRLNLNFSELLQCTWSMLSLTNWVPDCNQQTDQPSNSLKQNPSWEASSHSAGEETPRLLWNPKIHYSFHKGLPLSLSWARWIQSTVTPLYFPKIHSNVILPSMSKSSKWSLPFSLPTKVLCAFLASPIRATCLARLISLDLLTLIMFGEAYKLWSFSLLCSLLRPDFRIIGLFKDAFSTASVM